MKKIINPGCNMGKDEDVKDLKSNFGTKYNEGLQEAVEYAKTLEEFKE